MDIVLLLIDIVLCCILFGIIWYNYFGYFYCDIYSIFEYCVCDTDFMIYIFCVLHCAFDIDFMMYTAYKYFCTNTDYWYCDIFCLLMISIMFILLRIIDKNVPNSDYPMYFPNVTFLTTYCDFLLCLTCNFLLGLHDITVHEWVTSANKLSPSVFNIFPQDVFSFSWVRSSVQQSSSSNPAIGQPSQLRSKYHPGR